MIYTNDIALLYSFWDNYSRISIKFSLNLAKRLTDKQKGEILKYFVHGKTVEELSKEFNCSKLTITRNLKINLGERKYKETITRNKIEKDSKVIKSIKERNKELKLNPKNRHLSEVESLSLENDEVDDFHATTFLELTPLDIQIENSQRKEFSSVPLSEIDLPKTVFMIVDKQIELHVKLLKEYPEWSFLPHDDLNRKTIEIFFDLRDAKRLCQKEQKVIKVPNTDVFRIVSPILISRGISRIVTSETLISI